MKKHLLFLFAVLLPLLASAQTKVEIDGIWYNLITKAKQAEVTLGDTKYSGSITLPAAVTYEGVDYSVTSIGERAFYQCSSLTSITLPEGVTSIGVYAFYYCSSLTSITIPESVTSIGSDAFCGCSKISKVYISSIEAWCNIDYGVYDTNLFYDNGLYNYWAKLYLDGEHVTELIIPNTVTEIKPYTFANYEGLTAITIPESVTSIEERAFWYCSNLTSINIPEDSKLKFLGRYAFCGCSSLTDISIPKNVTDIRSYAFYGCSSLTSINIPEGVTSIWSYAFQNCSSLTSINIPESVTSIEYRTFYGCSNLSEIVLPKSLKYIRSEVFANCTELLDVYCHAEKVPSTLTDAFIGSYPEYVALHVPANALNAYKSTAPWSSFGTIVAIEDAEPMKKCAPPIISYVDGEVVFACETEGAIIKSEVNENAAGKFEGTRIPLTPTYTISAYATKENYEDSDIATATLCWIACNEEAEEPGEGIINIPSKAVLISTQGGTITVSGLTAGTEVAVYSTAGAQLATATATDDTATLSTDLTTGDIAIVKIGKHSIKVAIK